MSLLDALAALCQMIQGAAGIPADISAFAALIDQARKESRDIAPAEIVALALDDDQSRAALAAAIAKAEKS